MLIASMLAIGLFSLSIRPHWTGDTMLRFGGVDAHAYLRVRAQHLTSRFYPRVAATNPYLGIPLTRNSARRLFADSQEGGPVTGLVCGSIDE
jgi:hypothetical protein